jgi:hypothetical protein
MGQPSYMRSVVERNVVMRHLLVVKSALLNGWQVKLGPERVFINFRSKQITRILLNSKALLLCPQLSVTDLRIALKTILVLCFHQRLGLRSGLPFRF